MDNTRPPPTTQSLAADVLFILKTRLGYRTHLTEIQLGGQINNWRVPPEKVKRGDYRFPHDPTVRKAIVNALNWRRLDKTKDYRILSEDLRPLLAAARDEFTPAAPREEVKIPFLERWMRNYDVIAVSMLARPLDMDVVTSEGARRMFINYINQGKKFLSVSTSDASPPGDLSKSNMPGVFEGYLEALRRALESNQESNKTLNSFRDNVRFLRLPWSDNFYGFCRPRVREFIGIKTTRNSIAADDHWFAHLNRFCDVDAEQRDHFIALEQLDGLAFSESEEEERKFFGRVSDRGERSLLSWFMRLPQSFGELLHAYRLDPSVTSLPELDRRLNHSNPILIEVKYYDR